MSSRVLVFDTTLRDGEQSPGATMTPREKLRMAYQLDALGVDAIEGGFPISSPDDFEAVRMIAREVRGPVIAALARAKTEDIERAAAALEPAARPRIHIFLATSDLHLEKKLCITKEQCLERAVEAIEHARRYTDDVEFSAEDATRTDIAFLCRVADAAIEAGAKTLNIPDTVGFATPLEIRTIFATLLASVRGVENVILSAHCHNDLGLATANSLAAIEAGARQVECTVNGIGERAGNAALEEIVMALLVRGAAYPFQTSVHASEIARASRMVAMLTGIHPQPNKAVVGRNAFAHEAGIHQDGVIKEPSTYEIIDPRQVGVPSSRLVLGKHSGRRALAQRYRELGHEIDGEDLERAYRLFKLLADQKKVVLDEDLISILHHGAMDDVPQVFRLRALDVACGTRRATARAVVSEADERDREGSGEGDGPIAAAFCAIDAALGRDVVLEDLSIRAATPGRDAVGEVVLRAQIGGRSFTGRGASTDVVDASARAYLHALNKAEHARELEARALEAASDL
ncbi:MAG: 2-isopropylmalate synthase, partial [Longimicrobiales bacterium]